MRGDRDETDSNFFQLLKLRAEEDPKILQFLEKKTDKYTSSQIQNEIIAIMGLHVAREIASSIRNSQFFCIMADEVTDVSNKEQVVVCFCSVDERFEAQENLIGLHAVDSIKADNLMQVLKDAKLCMTLPLNKCRGQYYDGSANMCGTKSGAASQIRSEEPKAIFTHCFGHALNLAVADTVI